jgi:hypothetical protein
MDLKIFYPPAPLAMPAISLQDFTAERLLAGLELFSKGLPHFLGDKSQIIETKKRSNQQARQN